MDTLGHREQLIRIILPSSRNQITLIGAPRFGEQPPGRRGSRTLARTALWEVSAPLDHMLAFIAF